MTRATPDLACPSKFPYHTSEGTFGHYCSTVKRKIPDNRYTGSGRYGNGIFHCFFWGEEKSFISFRADRTIGSLISLCTSGENESLA
ncbi:hypothetical protein AVEN_172001-1 [Araneus ventricosus]|uniref:Uncharacterized protein n=2 Tax=Araneus ventricosus TaxID=182803 RepID=A0A4Y1ZRU6_ARAVE|nr:hypothetical protein AVEN_266617-1 [Araneus ventricosus]GBL64990.1 hypothetical protein AVEN_125466-1 [Araneus ventricosus]GBL65045.1 hypothetical protein AVEN_172001-1 [Araneus ventricosus]